jgi:hypothetical protein
MPEGHNRVSEAQKTFFFGTYGMSLFGFLFVGELGICPQNYTPTGGVEHRIFFYFPQGGMLKFTYKGHFLTI